MDILHVLRENPDDGIDIQDDKQASAFLRQIGIVDAFADGHTLAEMPTVQICGFGGVRTHFILAFLFSGCVPAEENGYLVSCAPRSGFAPGLTAGDFAESASREPRFRRLRVIVRTLPNLN